MASCTSSVLNRLRFTHLLNMQLSCVLHCWLLDAWHLHIVMRYRVDIPILTDVHSVPTYSGAGIWSGYIFAIIMQTPLLEICQEIALKLHCEKAERMYPRHRLAPGAPSRGRKGSSCAEAWNGSSLPGLMYVHQPDLMLAKDFSKKAVDGIAEKYPKCSNL